MKLTVSATVRLGVRASDPHRTVEIPCVELWADGIRFIHDCSSPEQARALAFRVSQGVLAFEAAESVLAAGQGV